jgi:putative transposase
MIDAGHPRLSIVRQCELASISRSSFYREPTMENEETLRLMRVSSTSSSSRRPGTVRGK